MVKQKRAKVGGEYGVNGLWYDGGEFLPSTEMGKLPTKGKSKGTGKQEIEPYKWEVAPADGLKSIYRQFVGVFGYYERATNRLIVNCSDETLAYFNTNRFAVEVMAAKFNKGERWI